MKFLLFVLLGILVAAGINATTVGAASTLPDNPYYVALGDSVAAGAGLNATGLTGDVACGRATWAYPNQVATVLNTPVTSLACSGAKIDEGLYGRQVRGSAVLPAQIGQAFSVGKPDLITMTIGANDARWVELIKKCYITTGGTTFDNAALKVLRADLRVELSAALYQIENYSYNNVDATLPEVYVSGYYTPFATAECVDSSRITAAELAWIATQTQNLNQAIYSVTPYFTSVEFVPLDFTGHELCSSDSWVQGLTATAPLHPTVDGQAAIAQSFVNAIYR